MPCARWRRRRPALYRQFGDKDGLLAAVVEAGFFEYLAGKRAATPSDDPVADLRAGWDAHTAFALAHPAHYRLMHSPSAQSADTALQAQALLRSVLERCAAAGVLTVSVDVATQMVMSANAGVALMLVVRPEQYPDPTLSQRVRDGIFASIIDESDAHPDASLNRVASTLDAQLAAADSTSSPPTKSAYYGSGSASCPMHPNQFRSYIMTDTTTRVAIVTGASGGIGRATAEKLAADGMAVAVHYSGNLQRAQETVDTIVAAGGRAIAVHADVADEGEVAALFDTVEEEFGGIDVVVHAAGIMILSTVAELNFDDFDRMHRTNVRGTFVVDQQAARCVRRGGAIINFSTSVKKLAFPTYAAYAATKGAVDAITLVLAKELRGRDITVNAVAPGPTATDLFLDGKDEATVENLSKLTPLERLGTPVDIAEAVAFLAGPARWVNGQVIYVNGGVI
ncbi:hypothetical protein GCM10020255_031890 [Rhodococcus baikonurensis]